MRTMQMDSRTKRHWMAGGAVALLFFALLSFRLGLFREDAAAPRAISAGGTMPLRDAWMFITQKGRKIGYAHRQFLPLKEGFRLTEEVFLRINTMGVVQPLRFRTEGNLDAGRLLTSFTFELNSSLFAFTARGTVRGNVLLFTAGLPGETRQVEVPLRGPISLSAGIFEESAVAGLKAGETGTLSVFDPAAMAERPVTVTRAASDEMIVHQGRRVAAKRYSLDFLGATQFAWVGEDGTVLEEKGILGMSLTRTTKEEALRGVGRGESFDLTQLASIPVDGEIGNPETRTELRVKLDNLGKAPFFLNGGRQTFRDGLLEIRRETLSAVRPHDAVGAYAVFLRPSPLIQSDDPAITAKAREIVAGSLSETEKAEKLVAWVYRQVKKQPALSIPNAVEVLRNLTGDCNEHAVLLAALARAAGIPAEVEAGLVYRNGRFYYHAWNVLYLGGWVTADAALGQFPADVTHLRFIRGSLEKQMDLLGLIGNVRLTIPKQRER